MHIVLLPVSTRSVTSVKFCFFTLPVWICTDDVSSEQLMLLLSLLLKYITSFIVVAATFVCIAEVTVTSMSTVRIVCTCARKKLSSATLHAFLVL
eukprot:16161-Heterococcus_DN1.PRE.1